MGRLLSAGVRPEDREIGRQDGRAAGRAYQCDVAADCVRAVVKALQSCACADGRSADAVVGNGELERLRCSSQRYLDLMGARVLDGVRCGLGSDVDAASMAGCSRPMSVAFTPAGVAARARERPQGGDEPSFPHSAGWIP
jgi:hypothetical protein